MSNSRLTFHHSKLAIVLMGVAWFAQSFAQINIVPTVAFDRSPGMLVASYNLVTPELAVQETVPLLRIYGDGLVVLYQPSYMKQPGRFEMKMDRSDMDRLVTDLAGALNGFDESAVELQREEAALAQWQASETLTDMTLRHVADGPMSVFYLQEHGLSDAAGERPARVVPARRLNWRALSVDARSHPGILPLQKLYELEKQLLALSRHSEMIRAGDQP